MLRVRPGVLLVRASFAPTSEFMTLDFPTLDRPKKAISGTVRAGKWLKSLAESINRARIRIQTVSSVWVADGKPRRKNSSPGQAAEQNRFLRIDQALRIEYFVRSVSYQVIASAMPKVLPEPEA